MRGQALDAMDPFFMGGKSDPYLVFKIGGKKIAETEVIKNNLNPRWKPIVLEIPDYEKGDADDDDDDDEEAKIAIECWDFDRGSANDIIGSVEVKCSELLEEDARFHIDRSAGILSLLTNHRKPSGTLIVSEACIESDDHRDDEDLVDRSKPRYLARGQNATSPVAKLSWKGAHDCSFRPLFLRPALNLSMPSGRHAMFFLLARWRANSLYNLFGPTVESLVQTCQVPACVIRLERLILS